MSHPDSPVRSFRPTRSSGITISNGVARLTCPDCGEFFTNTNSLVPGHWFEFNCSRHKRTVIYVPDFLTDDPRQLDDAA